LPRRAVASPGRGILAIDESNATCGKRLDSIGVENTEDNRRAYRELLLTTPGLGQYISGAILFEETLFQNTSTGKSMVQVMLDQKIVPGIKVDKVRSGFRKQRASSGLAVKHARHAPPALLLHAPRRPPRRLPCAAPRGGGAAPKAAR
jgi:hypothetical protein